MSSVGLIIRRHWKLLVFILGLVLICWLLWVLRNVLLPFIIGFIIALMILPIIRWAEKHLRGMSKRPQLKRITIIVVIYLLSLIIIGLTVYYIINVMGKALFSMAQDIPQIIPNGVAAITRSLKSLPKLPSLSIQQQIDGYLAQAGVALGNSLKDFLVPSGAHIPSSSGMILGFVSMPIFIFLILKDWDKIRNSTQAVLPTWALTHTKNLFSILQNVTGRYIRGQLLLGLVVGLCAGAMLFAMKIEFALPLAVIAGLTEMVPMIGPWVGTGLGLIVTLSTAPEKIIWVGIGYMLIQLLENNLLAPRIQGSQMQINPAFVIMLSVLGGYFAGILGFIIVLPLTMTILAIFKYLWGSARDVGIK